MIKQQKQETRFKIEKDQHKKVILEQPGSYIVELLGSGAEVVISGIFEANGDEKKEVSVTIIHKAPHTRADTTLKGVARDKGVIKFEGRIIIDKGCPDVNSFLTEKILLLSDNARAEAIPDLEIESDDVKCSHAATISKIPDEQVFYLMSRGLSEIDAKEAIVEGFLT